MFSSRFLQPQPPRLVLFLRDDRFAVLRLTERYLLVRLLFCLLAITII